MAIDLKQHIRSIKDFPKQGIMFRDITTILENHNALTETIEQLYQKAKDLKIDKVCGIESRGFIFGAMLAERLGCGFVPIRKPGKLPYKTYSANKKAQSKTRRNKWISKPAKQHEDNNRGHYLHIIIMYSLSLIKIKPVCI